MAGNSTAQKSTDIDVVMMQLDQLLKKDPGLQSAQHERWKRELILKLADLRRAEWGD